MSKLENAVEDWNEGRGFIRGRCKEIGRDGIECGKPVDMFSFKAGQCFECFFEKPSPIRKMASRAIKGPKK